MDQTQPTLGDTVQITPTLDGTHTVQITPTLGEIHKHLISRP